MDIQDKEYTPGQVSGPLQMMMWVLGLLDWPSDGKHISTVTSIGLSRVRRKLMCGSLLVISLLVTTVSTGAVLMHFVCNLGHEHHTMHFVVVSICFWPVLVSPQIITTIVTFSKLLPGYQHQRRANISWMNLFSEESFIRDLAKWHPLGGEKCLPRFGILIILELFATAFSVWRILFFLLMQKNCKIWLSNIWMFVEVFGLIYGNLFVYFMYLHRIFLEKKEEVREHVGELNNCITECRQFYKEYLQFRRLFLPMFSLLLFSSAFGMTVFFTLNLVRNNDSNSSESQLVTIPPSTLTFRHLNFTSTCALYCTEADYMHVESAQLFTYSLSIFKIIMGIGVAILVSKGRDVRHNWDKFRLNINLMYEAKDRVFWERLVKFIDRLQPATGSDVIHTMIIPLVGLGIGLLSGNHLAAVH
ncbi:uncharacterized protein [Apostichopus japonicus]|uniref:uncharacterized protein n=1 Tax=Stichopus japonicus TaxID=307972 RepID=UPI003AB90F58